MKSKFLKKTEIEEEIDHEEEFEDVEVGDGGPSIASAKKSKITIIAASSLLITVVLYFLFFRTDTSQKKRLVPVEQPKNARVVSGDSPFALDPIETVDKNKDNEVLVIPAAPEIPSLPKLPDSLIVEPDSPFPPLAPELPQNPDFPNNPINPISNYTNPNFPDQVVPVVNQADKPVVQNPELNPRYSPIIVLSGGGNVQESPGVGYDKNIVDLNERAINKLPKSVVSVKTSYVDDRTHAINQGKLLTAVLETAINTEVPGSVRAIVSRDVYGESGNEVLITRGSRLYGTYSSQISKGQGRVDISWTRLIRSDGVDLAIAFKASDQFGRSGISGEVDNKYGSIITNSLLTSILAVGGAIAAQKALGSNNNTTATTTAGVTTTTGNASAQAVADVTKTIVGTVNQIIGDSLNLSPVITVPQGTRITVVVNADMNIPSLNH
jgi:type IV secretion system protein VirB10